MGDLQKGRLGPAVKREKNIVVLPSPGRAQGVLGGQEVSWVATPTKATLVDIQAARRLGVHVFG